LNGRLYDLGTLGLEHRIKAIRELPITVANEKADRLCSVAERARDLPRPLRDPFGVKMGRAPGEVHAPTGDFNEEQHVQSLELDRVHRKEIHGQHARRLRPEKLTPWGTSALSHRAELLLTQDLLHRGRRPTTPSRAVSTDILHFPARVLVIQAARRGYGRATLIPYTVLPVYSGDRAIRFSRAVAAGRTAREVDPVRVAGSASRRDTGRASEAQHFRPIVILAMNNGLGARRQIS